MNRPALLAAMADVTTVNFGETVAREEGPVLPGAGRTIRFFLLFEAATFVVAALSHFGILVSGYEHRAAGTAESVIAGVLLVGWATTWVGPAFTRGIGLTAQTFALLGTSWDCSRSRSASDLARSPTSRTMSPSSPV